MYGDILGGHISLVCSCIEALFTLTIPAFKGLYDDIQFVAIRCTQQKLFKENKGSGEREQSIVLGGGSSFFSQEKWLLSKYEIHCTEECQSLAPYLVLWSFILSTDLA